MYKPVLLTIAVFNRRQKETIASGGKIICLINDSTIICTVLFFLLYINFSVSDFKFKKYKNIFALYILITIIEIELKYPIKLVSEKSNYFLPNNRKYSIINGLKTYKNYLKKIVLNNRAQYFFNCKKQNNFFLYNSFSHGG